MYVYHKSSDCFEYPKNPYLEKINKGNQKYLPNFPTQKIPESKISNPKNSFNHRSPSLEIQRTPTHGCMHKRLERYPGYAFHQLPKNP